MSVKLSFFFFFFFFFNLFNIKEVYIAQDTYIYKKENKTNTNNTNNDLTCTRTE